MVRGRKRVRQEDKKHVFSISMPEDLMYDLEWVSVHKYNYVTNHGTSNKSKLIRLLIIKELKKYPEIFAKYNGKNKVYFE